MSLLDDITRLARTLSPSEVPSSVDSQHVLGAIVKVLEHEGVNVAEELFPVAASVAAPEVDAIAAAAPAAAAAIEGLLARLEAKVQELEGKTPTVTPESSTPGSGEGDGGPTPAVAESGPAAPPLESAS